jgi:hypothetical protein
MAVTLFVRSIMRTPKNSQSYSVGRMSSTFRRTSNIVQSQVMLLSQKLQRMMEIERHHIISISNHDEDDLDLFRTWIEWCPKYEAAGGARGGKGLLHHVCRHCRKVSFHLLDKSDGVRQRICLGCWQHCHDQSLLPDWYYHNPRDCMFCKSKSTRERSSR